MEETTATTIDVDLQKSKDTTHFVFISRCGLAVDGVYYMRMINDRRAIDVGYKHLFLYYSLLKSDAVNRTVSNACRLICRIACTDLY